MNEGERKTDCDGIKTGRSLAMGRAHDDEEKHHGQDDLRHQTGAQSIFARRVVAESIRGESFGNVEVRRSVRDYVQQGGGCNCANNLRHDVRQDPMTFDVTPTASAPAAPAEWGENTFQEIRRS